MHVKLCCLVVVVLCSHSPTTFPLTLAERIHSRGSGGCQLLLGKLYYSGVGEEPVNSGINHDIKLNDLNPQEICQSNMVPPGDNQ